MFKKIPTSEWHDSMRGAFAGSLYNLMCDDLDIVLITADLGYGALDRIRDDFPDRFFNVGAAETAMLDIAVGMSLEGKKVFCYTITPFFWRAAETIRTYINHENLPVRLVGVGRDNDYKHDGYSHSATDIEALLELFPNIRQLWPISVKDLPHMLKMMVKEDKPWFISIKR